MNNCNYYCFLFVIRLLCKESSYFDIKHFFSVQQCQEKHIRLDHDLVLLARGLNHVYRHSTHIGVLCETLSSATESMLTRDNKHE